MRLSLVTCSGRELAALDANPSWRLQDLLAVVPVQDGEAEVRRRVFLGKRELRGSLTLAEINAESGSELTLVVTPSFLVATCMADPNIRYVHQAKIWSGASGVCLCTLEGHGSMVTSAVFSPDGLQALTASRDNTAKIWSVASGECLRTLRHRDWVRSAVFSPDGQEALTFSDDGTAKIWSVASGMCLRTLEGYQMNVHTSGSAIFSPDGLQVLTTSMDFPAKIWSVASGECLHTLEGHQGWVLSAVFSPDVQVLTAALGNDDTAEIWSVASGERLCTLEGHRGVVLSAVFSPDGLQALTTSKDFTAKIWSVASGECLSTLEDHRIRMNYRNRRRRCRVLAVFSPDGLQALTASKDGTVQIWSVASGECLCTLEARMARRSRNRYDRSPYRVSAVFSPDGQEVLTFSVDRTAADDTAEIWSVASGERLCKLEGRHGSFAPVASS